MKLRCVALALVVLVAPALAQSDATRDGWTFNQWDGADLAPEDLIAAKMRSLVPDANRLGELFGELVPSAETGTFARRLFEAPIHHDEKVWTTIHRDMVGYYGVDIMGPVLDAIRVWGGYASRNGAVSSWSASVSVLPRHHPIQDTTNVGIRGGCSVDAAEGHEIHCAIKTYLESYGDPVCGNFFEGSQLACSTLASAFDGGNDLGVCNKKLNADCDSGYVGVVEARLTLIDDEDFQTFVNDFKTTSCREVVGCDCGVTGEE